MALKNPTPRTAKTPGSRKSLWLLYLLPVLFVMGILGDIAYDHATHRGPPARKISEAPFATVKIDGLDARLFAQGDTLRASGDDLFIEFRNPQGALVDVGEVSFGLVLKMPGSVLHSIGKVLRTGAPGQYRLTLDPGLAGEWTADLSYSGPRGKAETSFPVKVT